MYSEYYLTVKPRVKATVISRILNLKKIHDKTLSLSYSTARGLRVSRRRYKERILDNWNSLTSLLANTFDVFVPWSQCESAFRKESQCFVPKRMKPSLPNGFIKADFPGMYLELYNQLVLNLMTPTIRKSMEFRTIVNRHCSKYKVFECCILVKFMRDAFRLAQGKSIELGVVNIPSVCGGAHSRNMSDILQINVMEEDKLSLLLNNQ